jgi:long-chain fatty acid transport protein
MSTVLPVRVALSVSWVALAVAVLAPASIEATGFYINQQSVKGLARVDAGNSAAADELGTIFFNPAGMPLLWDGTHEAEGLRTSIAFHLIVPGSEQLNRGTTVSSPGTLGTLVPVGGGNSHNPTSPTPVPNFYAAAPLAGGRGAFGLALNAPFGLAIDFDPSWHARYDATDASLRTVNLSLVGAYRFGSGLSVGGGLDVQYARTALSSAIPNPFAPGGPTPATDASIHTEGHDYRAGYNVGLLYSFDKDTRVGLHFRSSMHHNIEGTSDFLGLTGPLAPLNGSVDATARLNLPAITSVGVRTKAGSQLVLLGEFAWFDWSTFDEIRIRYADGRPDGVRPAHYRDAYSVAGGAEHPAGRNWTIRGGLHYDTTPTVDQFRDSTVPDSDRFWLGLGASLKTSDKISFDFAYNHVFFRGTSVDLQRIFFEGTPLATTVNVNSAVSSVVNNFSIDFHYIF